MLISTVTFHLREGRACPDMLVLRVVLIAVISISRMILGTLYNVLNSEVFRGACPYINIPLVLHNLYISHFIIC